VIDGAFGIVLSQLNCPFELVHGFRMMMFFERRKVITVIVYKANDPDLSSSTLSSGTFN